ncbi:hypothetical protein DI383_02820 [Flavobacteriaceae bacterium LYZ1037]|nr:hypothetical protein DI383_02820 [Flavobacteriaceae bacterium LYZ1037]
MDFDLYNDTFDAFFDVLPEANASVLDIGCGSRNITKYLLSKNPKLQITGADLSKNIIALAKKFLKPDGTVKEHTILILKKQLQP